MAEAWVEQDSSFLLIIGWAALPPEALQANPSSVQTLVSWSTQKAEVEWIFWLDQIEQVYQGGQCVSICTRNSDFADLCLTRRDLTCTSLLCSLLILNWSQILSAAILVWHGLNGAWTWFLVWRSGLRGSGDCNTSSEVTVRLSSASQAVTDSLRTRNVSCTKSLCQRTQWALLGKHRYLVTVWRWVLNQGAYKRLVSWMTDQ